MSLLLDWLFPKRKIKRELIEVSNRLYMDSKLNLLSEDDVIALSKRHLELMILLYHGKNYR